MDHLPQGPDQSARVACLMQAKAAWRLARVTLEEAAEVGWVAKTQLARHLRHRHADVGQPPPCLAQQSLLQQLERRALALRAAQPVEACLTHTYQARVTR